MLTDTQLILLAAAAQRDDGLLTPPERLKGGVRQRCIAKLMAHNLVEKVAVTADQPTWHEDADGARFGLKITPAGLRALGLEPEAASNPEAVTPDHDGAERNGGHDAQSDTPHARATATEPRAGTKQAFILKLLARPEGASLSDLTHATGWLAHTTRAALTGLRQRGHEIARTTDASGRSVYHLRRADPSNAATTPNVGGET